VTTLADIPRLRADAQALRDETLRSLRASVADLPAAKLALAAYVGGERELAVIARIELDLIAKGFSETRSEPDLASRAPQAPPSPSHSAATPPGTRDPTAKRSGIALPLGGSSWAYGDDFCPHHPRP
jgi:hypothetical protein